MIAVVIYRLAVAAAIYVLVNGLSIGPSVGGITVTLSAGIIQVVAIRIMDKIYTYLAYKLTDWGKDTYCMVGNFPDN